jgi:hypothetical protein
VHYNGFHFLSFFASLFLFDFQIQMACTCHCSGNSAEPVSLSPLSQVSGSSGRAELHQHQQQQQQLLRELSTTSSHYFTPVSSFSTTTNSQNDDSKEPDSLEYRPGPSFQ